MALKGLILDHCKLGRLSQFSKDQFWVIVTSEGGDGPERTNFRPLSL